ncbi:MAG: hypothetical protein JNL13_15035, partial [Chitinophagaceae bacterium]|nr:hypothetical protein [Chitinophagaceae bacterium]
MPSIFLRYASLLTLTVFFTSLFPVFPASAQQQSADRIIAKIGKSRIILQSDLEREFEQFKMENESAGDSMKCSLLQEMIFQKLLAEQADRDSVVISEEELEANMDQ